MAKTIYLTSGTTWTVPDDWNSSDNKIECIGGGASGGAAVGGNACASGAGGGAYSAISNLALTPGALIPYNVGSGGAPRVATSGQALVGNDGGDTWFNGATLAGSSVGAKGGEGGHATLGSAAGQALGGQAASGIGTTKFNGGPGGNCTTSACASGAGGAAGGQGAGLQGGNANSTSPFVTSGGDGDAGTVNGGGAGGGVGGSAGAYFGLAGNNGTNLAISKGSGGGGGAGNGGNGAPGGSYGGGGGGGGSGSGTFASGPGAQGIIVITYSPPLESRLNARFDAAFGTAAIWTGNGDAPFYNPRANISRIRYHSDFKYPKIIRDQTITQDVPARATGTRGDYSYTLIAHGLAGPPQLFAAVYVIDRWVPLFVSTPYPSSFECGRDHLSQFRFLSIGADATNVLLKEFWCLANIYDALAAQTITLRILVTDKVLGT